MLIFGNLLRAIAYILNILLSIYMWIVIIAALVSWVSPDPYNPIVRFLRGATDPVFRRVRRIIGIRLGNIDFSPMIVILAIIFLQYFIVTSLMEIADKLKTGGM